MTRLKHRYCVKPLMTRKQEKQVFTTRAARVLFTTCLSLTVCFYSLGLCFKDHCSEVPISVHISDPVCAHPVHNDNGDGLLNLACHDHPHPYDLFHLHGAAPVLIQKQHKESRSRILSWNFLPQQGDRVYQEIFFGGPAAAQRENFFFSSCRLTGQNLPLLI